MAIDEQLALRVRRLLSRRKGVSEKKMFGGICYLLNGNMCVGLWKKSLIVRFEKDKHAATLKQKNVKPFDVTGKALKGWALITPAGIKSDDDLKRWVQISAKYAKSLPAK